MKSILIISVILLCFHFSMVAQQKDSTSYFSSDQSGILPGELQNMHSPGTIPAFHPGFNSHASFSQGVLPSLNFNGAGEITDMLPFTNTNFGRLFPAALHPFTLTGRSVWDLYQGNYGIRTYTVNKKLYLGTAGIAGTNLYNSQRVPGYVNQTNFSSSLFAGYKFSEKFSISAGFTIQHNGNPLDISHQNRGFFP